jgi:hypothetical protein
MSTTLTRPAPAPHAGAILLFILAAVAAVCWLGVSFSFPGLQATGIPSTAARLLIDVAVLAGLWLGLARTQFDHGARLVTWSAIAIPLAIWQVAVWWIAIGGGFRVRLGAVPALPIAIVLPLLVGLPLLLRSRRIATILDAMPPYWLIGLQVYRIFGGIFLVAWAHGDLAGVFALPAGTGDTLTGLLALPTVYLLYLAPRENRQRAIAWNILGILDLVIAITIGFLSAPGPLQLIVQNPPNILIGTYPTVMIPAFAVPTSLMLHALSLRQLARLRRNHTSSQQGLRGNVVEI